MRKKIINNPFLDNYQIVFLFGSKKELEKYCNYSEGEFDKLDGCHSYNGRTSNICLFKETDDNNNILIIHEVIHAVQKMLDFLKIDCTYNNTELVANLMSYYIVEAMKFYKFKK